MTIPVAAKHLGITVETLRDWENGNSSPRGNKLQMLAGLYNVSLIWLLEGREDLDPLQNSARDLEMIDSRIGQILNLQQELTTAVSELGSEIDGLKKKHHNLETLAYEALPN